MIKNLKKLLPLAGTFLVLITLFCCDSTLIEDLDAIARKQTEGTYIYQTIIQKQNIDDNNYDKDETSETLNQPKTSTELKQWISDAIDNNSTYGFTLSNTPEVEHPEDNLYRLELIYDRTLYTLIFNANTTSIYEGTIPQSQTQKYEKQITLEFPELKLTDHMFLGWDENNTAVSPTYTTDNWNFTFYKDTTLYAIWQKGNATYTVYHYLNDLVDQSQYTVVLSQETLAGFAGETTTATALTFPGCEKYLNNIALKDSIEQQTISADGTTEVIVKYDRNKFTIYLDLAGGIFDTETVAPASPVGVDLVYGQDVAASITTFKRTGYTFTEWVPELPKTMEYTYKDITYEAQWDLIYYTIKYIVNGNETTDTYTIESETITLPVPDETEGYSFEGWYKDPAFADETKVEQIPQGSTGNITLYAKMTETSSGISITTPAVSFIEATITPTDDTFDTTTISDTEIKFQVDTDTLISSEQMTSPLTCQWYLDGELKLTDSIDSTDSTVSTYPLNISYDSVTAGSHILTLIITDSTGKIATGTKQFVVKK